LGIKTANCRFFCLCLPYFQKDVPDKLVNYIYNKIGKTRLKKNFILFLEPRLNLRIQNPSLTTQINVHVRFSVREILEKIAELKNVPMSEEKKKTLLEIEKKTPDRAKDLEKSDENFVLFKIETRATSKEKVIEKGDLTVFENKKIKEILNVMEEVTEKPYRLTTCSTHRFEVSKFNLSAGISLPAEIPLQANMSASFGMSELNGISIRFKDSPIGLEKIGFDLEDNEHLEITIRASYESSNLGEMMDKAYELSNSIADLLVKKVK